MIIIHFIINHCKKHTPSSRVDSTIFMPVLNMLYAIIIVIVLNAVMWCADDRISGAVILHCHASRRVSAAPTEIQTNEITSPGAIKSKLKNSVNVDCAQKRIRHLSFSRRTPRFSREYNFYIICLSPIHNRRSVQIYIGVYTLSEFLCAYESSKMDAYCDSATSPDHRTIRKRC